MIDGKEVLIYHRPIVDDNVLWVSSVCNNGLYKIDMNTNKCQFIGVFPNERFNGRYLHASSVKFENKLFFAPFGGGYIASYDIPDNKMNCVRLSHYNNDIGSLFYSCVSYKEFLYLIPCRYEYLVEINMENGDLHEYKLFDRDGRNPYEISPFVLKASCIGGGRLYIGENMKDTIIEFDIVTKELDKQELSYDLGGISNLEYIDNTIWIFGKNGRIVFGDPKRSNYEVLEEVDIISPDHYGVYFETLLAKNCIFASKSNERLLYKIDVNNKRITNVWGKMDINAKSDSCPVDIISIYKIGDEIRLLDSVTGETYRYDYLNDRRIDESIPAIMDCSIDYSQYWGLKMGSCKGRTARSGLELTSFLQFVIEGQYDSSVIYEGLERKSVIIEEGQ